MEKDNFMLETGAPEENGVSPADERKGKTLLFVSCFLFASLPVLSLLNLFLNFSQHVLFLAGGIVMMIGGFLQYKGFKLLKNDVLGNLPVWEAVSGEIIALISVCALLLQS